VFLAGADLMPRKWQLRSPGNCNPDWQPVAVVGEFFYNVISQMLTREFGVMQLGYKD
jgi:hypothetical protein